MDVFYIQGLGFRDDHMDDEMDDCTCGRPPPREEDLSEEDESTAAAAEEAAQDAAAADPEVRTTLNFSPTWSACQTLRPLLDGV